MNTKEVSPSLRLGFSVWAVILAATIVHLLGIHRPLLGNFSMYQTANAMMAQAFLDNRFTDLIHPQVNVLVGGQPGLLLLAYPVCALLAAFFQFLTGGSLDFWGRLQAVIFFAGSCVYLFKLCAYLIDRKTAFVSLIAFTFFPLTLIYGQSFQNEMLTAFFSITYLYFAVKALDQRRGFQILLAALSMSLVAITRPNFVTIGLPALYYVLQKKEGIPFSLKDRLFIFAGITLLSSVIPTLWYLHIWQLSHEAKNIYSTLFAQLQVRSSFASPLILTTSYYQKFMDLLTGMVLTPIGFGLWILGVLQIRNFKNQTFFYLWILSFAITGFLMPRKLLDHEFYWLQFLIPASVFIGTAVLSIGLIPAFKKTRSKIIAALLVLLILASSLRFSLHPAFKTSDEDQHLLYIAEQVKNLTDKTTSKIIVQGSHPILYYADRWGWPFSLKSYDHAPDYYRYANWEKLPQKQWVERNIAIKNPVANVEYLRKYEGATHLLILNPKSFHSHAQFRKYVATHYTEMSSKNNIFILYDLRQGKPPLDKPVVD